MKIIVFDTETTGIPYGGREGLEDQPHVCQFASVTYELTGDNFEEVARKDILIKPPVSIPLDCTEIHGINDEMVKDSPIFAEVADEIVEAFANADVAVAHNVDFDRKVIEFELQRLERSKQFLPEQIFDTMELGRDLCRIPAGLGRFGEQREGYKAPRLEELYRFLFSEGFDGAHNAMVDVLATGRCLKEMFVRGVFQPEEPVQDSLF